MAISCSINKELINPTVNAEDDPIPVRAGKSPSW
jgi:hypothetical protein